ncbi:M15 family metallopeptidase [Nocardioides euryhalodurans]|uniref:M15 family peptidase n=1 Tax=Nocardioides euryhalodurans TaxID=2518370 RepID=A0A4P7GL22_9ACTN|nr:M15 family metallopeptidase [Nocardioides euryhalodurans]QBR92818.1 M15 family peptidase [Nocardioides euryhalodurans]
MRRGWPATAAAATLLLVLTACSEAPTTGREPEPSGSPSPSEGASPTKGGSTLPVADPEHAVEPPGPLEDRLYRPDMLIFDREPLSDDMIKRIRALPEVAAAEVIGLGNVAIENQLLTVAAVDGATFRRFTPAGSAQTQDVWDRLAGGELAIDPRLGRKLQDEDGNLALGSGDDAPVVHIGAYAPQPETIDMVVNEAWVEDIGRMVLGNGLIISTDEDDPSTIRKRVQAIVGDTASVQDLDIASRLGLDPTATQTAFLTGGSIADVVGTFNYQVIGGGRIAPDPAWVAANIATEAVPILGTVTCHRAIFPQLRAALEDVVAQGLADEINPGEYAGCYYPRFIAGSTTLSNHSFGLALDLNVPGNQRGTVGEMDRGVVAAFKRWGFAWGGDWSYTDPMHFEMAQLVDPR